MSEEQNKQKDEFIPMNVGSNPVAIGLPKNDENVSPAAAPLEQEAIPQSEKQISSEEHQNPTEAQQESQTTAMEVHHHGHVHEKKKWKEYVFQFFMLFLAVFCGFLAEYQLEHKIERDRAKQYVKSFYEDLKNDTARISFNIMIDDEKLTALDSLNDCFNAVSTSSETTCLFALIKHSSTNRPFKMTERTLNQLANAGGFRLLQKDDADSMNAYQKEFDNFNDFQNTAFQDAQYNVRISFNQLINFSANVQMFKPDGGQINMRFSDTVVTAPLLFSTDDFLRNKYFNELLLYYRVTFGHKRMMLGLKEHQTRLIEYFKNKYGLE